MRTFVPVVLLLCALLTVTAQQKGNDPEFERFKKEQQQGVEREEEAFRNYSAEVTKAFERYAAEQERLFREYTGQIGRKWGNGAVRTSTREEYVAYDPQFGARRSINYEQGTAKVEVLVTEEEARNPAVVERALKEQVRTLALSKGGTDPLEVKSGIPPAAAPIAAGQLTTTDGAAVTERSAERYADETIKKAEVTQQVVTGTDGIRRVVIGVQMPLVPDHVKRRAAEFRTLVRRESDRFGIDITLVYAVMHTESYFNPRARSAVPAFGLMQLVPRSGARDAFFFARRKDSLVTGEYLYIPAHNIELGAAYLTKLLTVDFKGVKDPASRMYCAIAAYNTGPGNVARSFTGKRNIAQALPKINALSSAQLFDHLRRNLPYEETRSYIVKVSERMGLYHEWRQ